MNNKNSKHMSRSVQTDNTPTKACGGSQRGCKKSRI